VAAPAEPMNSSSARNGINSFERVSENGGHFSRIDIAIDDFDGIFTLEEIEQKVQNGEIISYFRRGRILKEYNLGLEDNLGQTIYFGSPQSRIRIRMYDKAIEQLIKETNIQRSRRNHQRIKGKSPGQNQKRKQTNPRRTIQTRTPQPQPNLAKNRNSKP